MKVPFFRSKATAKKAADDSDAEKLKRSLVSSASMSTIPRINNMAEMDRFLLTIDTFQTEARKLFPENAALDQILDELRTECRRRLDYMTRVSTPSWVAQRPSSSSTINVASSQLRVRAKTVNESPLSTTTMASNTSDESSSSSDISISANKLRSQVGSNGAATAQTVRGGQSTQAGRRDARLAENRRRNMPQSMFVSNVPISRSQTMQTDHLSTKAWPSSHAPACSWTRPHPEIPQSISSPCRLIKPTTTPVSSQSPRLSNPKST
ncbi:hypothetical protein BX070DRAFT_82183 [Coemansia spiralis]|nr:hypothetical protein BX070DRAFT_82183 [Coemansia spiralis]